MARMRMFAGAVSVAAVAGLAVGGASEIAGAAATPAVVTMAGSLAPFTSHARALGNVRGGQRLSILLWLRPRTAAASRFADAVSTPGSPQFHHYLSPDAYAARFGATRSEAGKVESWLRAEGFTAVGADSQRAYVRATAAASVIGQAFDVRLKMYQPTQAVNAGRYALWSNDRPVSLPASLAGVVAGVSGLDNAGPAGPQTRPGTAAGRRPVAPAAPCSAYYGQHLVAGLPAHFGRTTFPTQVCGYSARQIRAAYGANLTNTGQGQVIALAEAGLDPDMLLTLHDYAKASGLPLPSSERYAQKLVGKACTGAPTAQEPASSGQSLDIEEQIDVESAYAMAPAAKELVVSGQGCSVVQGYLQADQAILDGSGHHPLATIASNSWEGATEGAQPASLTKIEHDYLLQATAEGVGMYFASGDDSGVWSPADDPDAIAVGGTTLGIGESGQRLFETGWSTGLLVSRKGAWVKAVGERGAGGGGPSVLWKQPAYQRGVVPAALSRVPGKSGQFRSVPDISADADPLTGMRIGVIAPGTTHFSWAIGGGTSQATPLVAGLVAAAQQGEKTPFGFLNPALYKLAGTQALHDAEPITTRTPSLLRGALCNPSSICGVQGLAIFDDQSLTKADGYTGQVTLKGYDNMTGLGTPAGQQFITALRAEEK
jgi:subtilase family serine protease